MDAVPRISRAQSLDVLSLDGQHRRLPGRDRGRARVRPVLHRAGDRRRQGAAGQGAGGRAPAWPGWRRSARPGQLGAIVRATDPRPEVADQVRSLGGEYLSIESPRGRGQQPPATPRRWATTTRPREAQLYAEQAKDVDIIITTALIPGRPAPRMITGEMVASMKPGQRDRRHGRRQRRQRRGHRRRRDVVTANGVTIIGYTDLAGRLPAQASPALRHQPGQPAEAAHPGEGRPAGARLRRRRPALDDRGARRRDRPGPRRRSQVSAAPAATAAAAPAAVKPRRSSPRRRPAGSASSAWPRRRCS